MKRKGMSVLLIVVLIAAVVTGCGKTDSSSQELSSPPESATTPEEELTDAEELSGTLSILSWYNETQGESVISAFNEVYPDIEIDYQFAPPVGDYVEKLSTLLFSGAAPDLFYMALENREDLIKGNYCMDLSGETYMTDGTIPESAQKPYSKDGEIYALAVDCWAGGVFYNVDLFEQVGVTEEPKTWDEFLHVCQLLTDANITPIMDNAQDAAVNLTAPLYGSEIVSKDPGIVDKIYDGEATFEDTWSVPFSMFKELVDLGYLSSDMVGATIDEIVTAFATGQTAMMLTGSWQLPTIDSINPDLNYMVMGVPGNVDTYYCGAVNVGLSINSATENEALAKAFLDFCASPEGLEAQYLGYGGFTLANGFTPEVPAQIADGIQNVRDGKFYIPMGEWFSYTESLRLTYVQSLQDCMVGTATPEEAAARLDEKLAEVSGN